MQEQYICSEEDDQILVFENNNISKQVFCSSKKATAKDDLVKKPKIQIKAEFKKNPFIDPEDKYGRNEEGERGEESIFEDGKEDTANSIKELKQNENEAIIFPYTIRIEDKIELVKGTNVWISKTELQRIEEKCEFICCEDKHRTMTRFLLCSLLGSENFKHMSVSGGRRNGKFYTPLPEEVYSAVRSYVMQDCKSPVCQTTILKCITYRHYIANIFKNARRNPVTEIIRGRYTDYKDIEIRPTLNGLLPSNKNLNEIVFPYMVWNEKKVEIILQTKVWIYKVFLNIIKETWKNKQNLMTRNLMRHLLGPENMKYMTLTGKSGFIPMPNIVYFAIRTFVTQNCSPDAQLSTKEFEDCMNDAFERSRKNLHKISTDKSTSTSESRIKTIPENYFPGFSPNYFGSSWANNCHTNFAMTSEIREPNIVSHSEPQNNVTHQIKRQKLSSDNNFAPQVYSFPEAEYPLLQYATPVNFYNTLSHHPSRYYKSFNFNYLN